MEPAGSHEEEEGDVRFGVNVFVDQQQDVGRYNLDCHWGLLHPILQSFEDCDYEAHQKLEKALDPERYFIDPGK